MTLSGYNRFCASLPHATHVVQWSDAHVWKVGGKVFAIASRWDGPTLDITFKCSPLTFDLLKNQPGMRPAPYLASRGMKWIQHYAKPGLSDNELRDYLRRSHRIVSRGLSKKKQSELGLTQS